MEQIQDQGTAVDTDSQQGSLALFVQTPGPGRSGGVGVAMFAMAMVPLPHIASSFRKQRRVK